MKNKYLASLLAITILTNVSFAQQPKAATAATTTGAGQAVKPQTAPEIPYVNKVLPNGLEVIVLPDASVPIATIELAVRTGSFTEPPELNGLSHLYEHMFFKPHLGVVKLQCENATKSGRISEGGKVFCANQLKMAADIGDVSYLFSVDQTGFVRNGQTQEEYVNYYYTTTSPNVGTIMRMMRDAMLYPMFDEDEFAKEKQVVIGELDRHLSEPSYYLDRTLMDKLFYKYPSRKSPGGNRETVGSATTEKMRLIQSRYYVPNNSALIVTGDVQAEQVFKLAEELFGVWKKGEDPFVKFPIVEHPPLPKSEGVIVNQPVENVIVQIGWHGPSIGKDDASTYAADIFSYIVGQPNSQFQRKLVDSGLAVAASVHYYTQRNVGPIRITLVTTPEKSKAALDALYKEIAQFNNPNYFTDEELASAKTIVEAQDLFFREKLSDYTHTLGFWWSSTGIDYFRGYQKNLRAVSRDNIKRYVTTYIQGKPHVGVALISTEAQQKANLTEQDLIGK